jgi:5-deoxy-glucuronate isomerase
MTPYSSPLLVAPDYSKEEYIHVDPVSAGWEHLHFAVRNLSAGKAWAGSTGENEMAIVILGGTCRIDTDKGTWDSVGHRMDVFHGMPYTLYLPRRTAFSVQSTGPSVNLAYGWAAASRDYSPRLITPAEVEIEIRGGENATRQINKMIPPGFPCERLVVVEVYTPSGNWSSYPPHKHDVHRVDANGKLVEADLEEIYFYQVTPRDGFAYQRIYTDDRRLDELILVKNDQLVLSPEGYHPVVSGQGYTSYYLNMLAGSAQSLASSDDPQYAWIKDSWKYLDPRLPIVSLDMEK